MKSPEALVKELFTPNLKTSFDEVCLEIFHFQAIYCELYKTYLQHLNINHQLIKHISEIPFLPIEFFKTHKIISKDKSAQKIFESSGTTGKNTSKHYVADIQLYRESFLAAFNMFYGNPHDWCIIGLLPSYLERENSSLVFMVDELIKKSDHLSSGFHLHDIDNLIEKLQRLEAENKKVWLIGVTYALLDLAEKIKSPLNNCIVVETGGMKGNRPEMVREEVHKILCEKFSVKQIHSEYGMTELLSQAYSSGNGIFYTPPWMKIIIRDVNDPLTLLGSNKAGGINVIDLANIYSCSFIASQDVGKTYADGAFEVLGRFDNSDIRGCNLLLI